MRLLELEESKEIIRLNLGLSSGDFAQDSVPNLEIRTAAVRAALWCCSNEGTQPTYITRVLNLAATFCGFRDADPDIDDSIDLQEESSHDHIYAGESESGQSIADDLRMALAELEILGDVARLPRGYLLPAPLRCIEIGSKWLLVGGIPSHILESNLADGIRHHGAARSLAQPPDSELLNISKQSIAEWSDIPSKPLAEWTNYQLSRAKLDTFEGTVGNYEVYSSLPTETHFQRPRFQYCRWTKSLLHLPSGRYLARHKRSYGPVDYLICQIENGQMVKISPLDDEETDIRRLVYGIDARENAPVMVRLDCVGDSHWFELENELPRGEQRLFSAIGRLHAGVKYYPRRWEIPDDFAEQASIALQKLGVLIESSTVQKRGQR